MAEEKNDMFPDGSKEPDLRKMLDAFSSQLSETDRAAFENRSPDDPFYRDAAEGLQAMENREELPQIVQGLNRELRRHLSRQPARKGKKDLRFGDWIYWSIGIILLLALAGFLVLRLLLKH